MTTLVPPEVYHNLSSDYKKALIKLEEDIYSTPDFETCELVFLNFTKKFTTFPQMWIDWICFIQTTFSNIETQKERIFVITKKALRHFYYNNIFMVMIESCNNQFLKYKMWTQLVEYPFYLHLYFPNLHDTFYILKVIENKLFLPSNQLQPLYETYQMYSNKPMTKEMEEKYANAVKLYEKILTVKNDDHKKWLFYMKETNDPSFIILNFEQKLGNNVTNSLDKSLWELYLTFLEESGFYMIKLYTYSRYCRLFMDDENMEETYEKEIEKLKNLKFNVQKYQIDLIKFRRDFHSDKSSLKLIRKYLTADSNLMGLKNIFKIYERLDKFEFDESDELSIFQFKKENVVFRESKPIKFNVLELQEFGIPENILFYVLKKASFHLLEKLYSSSKQLYSMIKIPICHRLEISDRPNTVSFQQGLYLSTKMTEEEKVKNLYLTNSLDVISKEQNTLSKIIPKIYKCEIQFLIISGQNITLEELEFLTKNVKSFHAADTVIGERENVSIKDIIDRLPKVTKFKINNLGNNLFLSETSTSKICLPKKNRIEDFYYRNVTEMVDANLLYDFITETCKQNSSFILILSPEIPESFKIHLKNVIQIRMEIENQAINFNVF